jgi:hypothetical protein
VVATVPAEGGGTAKKGVLADRAVAVLVDQLSPLHRQLLLALLRPALAHRGLLPLDPAVLVGSHVFKLTVRIGGLPDQGVIDIDPKHLDDHVQGMQAVVTRVLPARAAQTLADLHCVLAVLVVLEREYSGPFLVDQIQPRPAQLFQQWLDVGWRLLAPACRSQ